MMSQSTTDYFYAVTPYVLWPILWVQIFLMNRTIAALKAAAGGEIITYSVAIRRNGTLYLRWLSDNARGIRPIDEWRPATRLNSDLFASEVYACPHLRHMPGSLVSALMGQVHDPASAPLSQRSRPAPGMRIQGEDALYLDPG